MAHEIYYTSSPEGLKAGQAGFCTVGATEGLPATLLKRLESLSAYRHLSDGGGSMPVAYAHWLLQLGAGKDHHVLSRICDSGLDYTGRTNALAHHVVLETGELAPGGPAWMLAQPGVMLEQWDGRVGSIARGTALPRGTASAGVCAAWQRLTGDAGWGGVLAETFVKSPWKPVCVLFAPGQNMLPLMAEAIGLIPPAMRWQVTFNTYFTSVPSNVVCLWRCCLAGTPAAATTMRYAASGLVLDLSNPARLGAVSDSPWVRLARTGHGDPSKLSGAPAPPPAKRKAAFFAKPPPIGVVDEPDEESAEAPPPLPEDTDLVGFEYVRVEEEPQESAKPKPVVRQAGGTTRRPNTSWAKDQAKQRMRRLTTVFILACVAIVGGVWLQMWAYRSSSDREVARVPASVPAPVLPETLPTTVPTFTPITYVAPPKLLPQTRPLAVTKVPDVKPVEPVAPTVRPPPKKITLGESLRQPVLAGLRDVTQSMAVGPGEFDDLAGVVSIRLVFPSAGPEYALRRPEITGTFTATSNEQGGIPRVLIRWREAMAVAGPADVAELKLDKGQSKIELTWRAGVVMRQPQVAAMLCWVLQNSLVVLVDRANQRPQQLELKPVDAKAILADAATQLKLPCEILGQVSIRADRGLPPGWKAMSNPLPGEKSLGTRNDWSGSCAVSLDKPDSAARSIIPAFVIRFMPADGNLESDYAVRKESFTAELIKASAESRRLEKEIREAQALAQADIDKYEKELKKAERQAKMTPEEMEKHNLTPESIKEHIDGLKQSIATQRDSLATSLQPAQAKKKESDELCRLYKAAVDSFNELDEMDLVIESPEGLRLAVVRFSGAKR